jgi:hypothetical protein
VHQALDLRKGGISIEVYARILLIDESKEVIPLQTAVASSEQVDEWVHRICDILDYANEAGHGVDLMAQTYKDE